MQPRNDRSLPGSPIRPTNRPPARPPAQEDAIDTTSCPECGEIAEVRERSVLESTDGPIEHAKIVCVERHWFLLPVSYLHSSPAPSQNPRVRSPR